MEDVERLINQYPEENLTLRMKGAGDAGRDPLSPILGAF